MTTKPSESVDNVPVHEIYLDNNATTQPLPEVVQAVTSAMIDGHGNPSSVHSAGARARRHLQQARRQVAALLRSSPEEIVFTSGATEANNLVLQNLVGGAFDGFRLVTTAVEHASILAVADHLRTRGVDVKILPVDADGLVDSQEMLRAIVPGRTLVSIQWANNETGVLQPISELACMATEAGAIFHTDAVQAVGKAPIDMSEISVDLLSLSGHKVHGPHGVGAVVGRRVKELRPQSFGGSQEGSLRPGTENVAAIAGLGVALEERHRRYGQVETHVRALRDVFESRLEDLNLVEGVNGGRVGRVPNASNVRFSNVDGEALTIRLDRLGVRCSQSSACANQRPEPSYVLRAMGLSEDQAYASVRFGFSELNTMEDVEIAVRSIATVHARIVRFAVA